MAPKRLPVSWKSFSKEVFIDRVWKSKNNPILMLYLIIIVGFVGSSGVWLPILISDTSNCCFNLNETLSVGLSTYCIALLAASMADNLLSKNEKSKTVRFFIFCIFTISYIIAFVTIFTNNPWIGGVTTVFTYLMWVITYSMDSAKQDTKPADPYSTVGGNLQNALGGTLN